MSREALRLPAELLSKCRVLPSRYDLIHSIPHQKVIAEVGVGLGGFSQCLLDYCKPSHFIAIDCFSLHELDDLWGKPPSAYFGEKTHKEFYTDIFQQTIAAGCMTVLTGDSPVQISSLEDESVDVFYVDGDHTYEGVKRDLEAIRSKIKPSGLLILNDYTYSDGSSIYGVVQAANEFMVAYGYQMTVLCLEPFMLCDVVLQRVGDIPLLDTKFADAACRETQLVDELKQLRSSTSWRITAPARRLFSTIQPFTTAVRDRLKRAS